MHRLRASSGFTLIELVTILVLVGILAAVALPRMDGADVFRSMEFRDRAVAALRHARKTAISQRRMVCATFTASRVTLAIDRSRSGGCDAPLAVPGGTVATVDGNGVKAVFSAVPANLFFQPDGRVTTDAAGSIAGGIDTQIDGLGIRLIGTTGFIGDAS